MGACFALVATILLRNAEVLTAPGTICNTKSAAKMTHTQVSVTMVVTDIWDHDRRKFILC